MQRHYKRKHKQNNEKTDSSVSPRHDNIKDKIYNSHDIQEIVDSRGLEKLDKVDMDGKIKCVKCLKKYKKGSGYKNHARYCNGTYNIYNHELEIIKIKLDMMQKFIEEKDKRIEFLEKDKESDKEKLTKIIDKSQDIQSKTLSIFNMLQIYHGDAPPLEHITDADIEEIIYEDENRNSDFELAKTLSHYESKGTLHVYLANSIIGKYKCDNIEEQSLWGTDVTRMNYIVREVVDDVDTWVKDPGGKTVSEIIIIPLMTKLHTTVIRLWNMISKNHSDSRILTIMDNLHSIEKKTEKKQIWKINKRNKRQTPGKLHNKILKELTPHFKYDVETNRLKFQES